MFTQKELGDFERVKTLLGESLDAQKSQGKKEDLYSNYLLGNAYLESGDVDKAIETLTLTVNQNPNDKYASSGLAFIKEHYNDIEEEFTEDHFFFNLELFSLLLRDDFERKLNIFNV